MVDRGHRRARVRLAGVARRHDPADPRRRAAAVAAGAAGPDGDRGGGPGL